MTVAALVALCVLTAWPPGSMVAAQPAARSTGNLDWIRLFAIVQLLALVVFGLAVVFVRRHPPSTGSVVALAAVIQLLPLVAPLMLSTDAWSYWNAGRIAVAHDANPYAVVPAAIPSEPSLAYIPAPWRDEPTRYGPAFTVISQAVAIVAGEDAGAAAWLFRALAGGQMVALTVLVARLAPRAAFGAAFVGWNPVYAFQFAGSGHNDVLMAALVVLALFAAHKGAAGLAGVSWVLAILVKWLPLALLPLQLLEDRARGRASIVPSLLVGTLVAAALSTVVFGWSWLGAWLPIVSSASSSELNSLAIWPRLGFGLPDVVVTVAPLAVFGVAYLVLLRQAWGGRARNGLASGLLLLASPFLWTWYVITPAALSSVEDDVPALWVAAGLCLYSAMYLGISGSIVRVFFG